jgi:hypothetical protein
MKPEEPGPVKLVIGILFSDGGLMERGLTLLSERYGSVDYRSPAFPFSQTEYYVPEMGSPIFRIFVSHERLIHPRELARVKIETNEMEDVLAIRPAQSQRPFAPAGAAAPEVIRRRVNLDPGYMDYDKFVLASAKYNGQKVYLDLGIWADLTLHYEKGKFDPYPWSFPDFKSRVYDGAFMEMRRLYKDRRKSKECDDFIR